MPDVTLHLKDAATGLCVVCGADLGQRVSRWWLTNCWTGDPRHYKRQPTMRPGGDAVQPCGVLPPEKCKTPNAANQRAATAPQTL
jgi:hypothetical protein